MWIGHHDGRRIYRDERRPTGYPVGGLFAFMMLIAAGRQPLVGLARLIEEFEEVGGAIGEAAGVFNRPLEVDAASGGLRPRFAGGDHLRGRDFTYLGHQDAGARPDQLHSPAGTMLGIVGRSGSGKSTITRLLQGINRDYSDS